MSSVVPIRKAFASLGVSKPTGYQLVNSGELLSYKIGARRYTTNSAIEEFIQSRFKAEERRRRLGSGEAA